MSKSEAEFIAYVNTFEDKSIRKYLAKWYKILEACDPFQNGREKEPFFNFRNGHSYAAVLTKFFVIGDYLDTVELSVFIPEDCEPGAEQCLKVSIIRSFGVPIASVEDDPAIMTRTKLESKNVERIYLTHIQASLDANSLMACYFGVGISTQINHLKSIVNLITLGANP